ncbi:MAG: dihydropteroate synthase, partial [Tepidisphaeraceae bacterium]
MNRDEFETWLRDERRDPLVMGVLNVTPDSFSDGGKFAAPRDAAAHA